MERTKDELITHEQTIRDAIKTITPETTEEKAHEIVRSMLGMVAHIIRLKNFERYNFSGEQNSNVTDEECIGIALGEVYPKDSSIVTIAKAALKEHTTLHGTRTIKEKV